METQPQQERILFIDDEPEIRLAFSRSIRSHGFDVDLASGWQDALLKTENHEYAVVATDYRMPDCDGMTLAEKLKKTQPDATYMLVTGYCDLGLALNAVNRYGFSYVLPKPWDIEELCGLLRQGLTSYWERVLQNKLQQNIVEATKQLAEQQKSLRQVIERGHVHIAEMLVDTIEAKGYETKEHCRRVAIYSTLIADKLGIRGEELASIQHGALLHDIGLLSIPESILCKESALLPDEWDLMKRHPVVGARVLEGIESLREARMLVMQHHERWDGSGYPSNLKQHAICVGARIFAVADTLDSLLSGRPYRAPLSVEGATEVIKACSGKDFDPDVVHAFLTLEPQKFEEVKQTYVDRKI